MSKIVNMSRRDVVKGIGGMTGLVLGFHIGSRPFPFAEAARRRRRRASTPMSISPSTTPGW
jgi:hypothetical protein